MEPYNISPCFGLLAKLIVPLILGAINRVKGLTIQLLTAECLGKNHPEFASPKSIIILCVQNHGSNFFYLEFGVLAEVWFSENRGNKMPVEDLSRLIVQIFSIFDVCVRLWNHSTSLTISLGQR